jgi:hypothetical protein
MGELATYNGETIKIGTCESMYYLRADQAHLVEALAGNIDPVSLSGRIRFRFPFPDEDGISPGAFKDYNRGIHLPGLTAPDGVEHYKVQFKGDNGYLCSLPCPESGHDLEGVKIARNGYGGAVELVAHRVIDGDLIPVLSCKGCGAMWRESDPDYFAPIAELIERQREEQAMYDRRAEHEGQPAAKCGWHFNPEVLTRILDGYNGGWAKLREMVA